MLKYIFVNIPIDSARDNAYLCNRIKIKKNNQMKKLVLSFIIMSFVWVSCDNQPANEQGEAQVNEVAELAPKPLDINKFDELAGGLANQLIEIKGTVLHTCKHGGTKMFLAGDDENNRVKINATDESGNFNAEMEGSDYVVVGILDEYRVDEAELDKLEADILSGNVGEEEMKHKTHEGDGNESEHVDHGGDGGADVDANVDDDIQEQLEQIKALRDQLAESGKEYLSFYSINAKSFREAK